MGRALSNSDHLQGPLLMWYIICDRVCVVISELAYRCHLGVMRCTNVNKDLGEETVSRVVDHGPPFCLMDIYAL